MQAEYLIRKKKSGQELGPDELKFLLGDWLRGRTTDRTMLRFLRAVHSKGLTFMEMVAMMQLLKVSDVVLNQSPLPWQPAELHSIDGVGERVQLLVGAIVSAVGVPMLELSGPGIGYAVSPLDKLSGLPGFSGTQGLEALLRQLQQQRFGVVQTSERLAPAAKRLYALCEQAGILTPVPFFVVLEMARLLAGGAQVILLDVPFGPACLVHNLHDAVMLARTMCALGETAGRRMGAVVSELAVSPGRTVGPLPEFAEAVRTLQEEGDPVLLELALDFSARLLYLAGRGSLEKCRFRAERVVHNGVAADKLLDMAEAQGADPDCLDNLAALPQAPCSHVVRAPRDGWISGIRPDLLGEAAVALRASRRYPEDTLDAVAGLELRQLYRSYVKKGDEIAVLHAAERGHFSRPAELVRRAFRIGGAVPPVVQYLHAWVDGTTAELLLPPEAVQEPAAPLKDNVIRLKFPKGAK